MLLRWLIHNLVVPTVKDRVIETVNRKRGAVDQPEEPDNFELPPCEIALLFGSAIEAEGTRLKLTHDQSGRSGDIQVHAGMFAGKSVILAVSGEGPTVARAATLNLLDALQPNWIVASGFATGLCDDLRRGQIIMPNRLLAEGRNELEIGFRIDPEVAASTPGLHVGRLLSVDRLVRTPEERRRLAELHAAFACDCESAAVAEACRERGTRFLAIRVVSDTVDDRLPPDVEALIGQTTLAGKLGATAGTLFHRPKAAQDLWKMRDSATRASDRLANFLAGVVPQLT